jgi:mono/diheme cytochrome c family protein
MSERMRVTAGLAAAVMLIALVPASAQQRLDRSAPVVSPSPGHEQHGTPKGWKFAWPKGDPAKGRAVFVKLECYSCHEVRGEKLPAPTEGAKLGPELSFMGPLHEVDYFAEAIINPSAVIEKGKGYEAPDGSSKMPSFNDSLNVQGLIDLVAFLRALRPPAGGAAGHRGH